ncbi:MAG: hypothetical protein K0Q66_1250 [Chitinophagaceae bacterium]|jgi:hypothetical protein|nr:hypothetical protein [Chitinophagaceae bacterium]
MKHLFFALMLVFAVSGCKKVTVTTISLPDLAGGNGENEKAVGASARSLLAATDYAQLEIQVSYMPGMQLQPQSINNLVAFLNTYLNKPGGITVTEIPTHASGQTVMNVNDIGLHESHFRTAFTTGTKIAVHVLVADAAYENANVLGLAYRNTSVALMGKTIQQNSGGLTQPSRVKLETTVLLHEFAHLLGLVDLGSPMQASHKDASHGNHCNNSNCLMHYSAESTDILGFLVVGNIPSLDANCVADLKANGGK